MKTPSNNHKPLLQTHSSRTTPENKPSETPLFWKPGSRATVFHRTKRDALAHVDTTVLRVIFAEPRTIRHGSFDLVLLTGGT